MKITIPTKWSEVRLSQWKQYRKSLDVKMSELQRMVSTVSVFSGIELDILDDMPYTEVVKLYKSLDELLSEEPQGIVKDKFSVDGVKYGIVPDFTKLTTSEWATIDELSKDYENNLHLILSVIYRPIVKTKKGKYKVSKFKDTHENFLMLDMETVAGASVFFYSIDKELLETSLAFMVDQSKSKKHHLQKLT